MRLDSRMYRGEARGCKQRNETSTSLPCFKRWRSKEPWTPQRYRSSQGHRHRNRERTQDFKVDTAAYLYRKELHELPDA